MLLVIVVVSSRAKRTICNIHVASLHNQLLIMVVVIGLLGEVGLIR